MKVTKYPQSCLVLEHEDTRLLIDPGNLAMDAYNLEDFGDLDAVLYTHRHADHFDQRHVDAIHDRGIEMIANADVCGLLDGRAREVADGDRFEVAGLEVSAHDLPHVEMVDGSAGPPNTGYVVEGTFFHPGDGIALDGLQVETLALPIVGPSISFRDAYRFTQQTGASRVIPIHYDMFTADPDLFAHFCDVAEVVVLGHGESTSW